MTDHGDRLTRRTDGDVAAFLDGVADDRRRADAQVVLDMMRPLTGVEPRIWGASMVGFGHQPKGCLYIKRLDDVDRDVLEGLIMQAWQTNHVEDASG